MKKALERDPQAIRERARIRRRARGRRAHASDPKITATMLGLPTGDEATMHLTPLPKPDTLHRETVRSQVVDAGPTIRTPLPARPPGRRFMRRCRRRGRRRSARSSRGRGAAADWPSPWSRSSCSSSRWRSAAGSSSRTWLFDKTEEVAQKKDNPVIPPPQPPSTTTVDVSDPTTTTPASALTIVEERPDPVLTSTVRTGTSDPVQQPPCDRNPGLSIRGPSTRGPSTRSPFLNRNRHRRSAPHRWRYRRFRRERRVARRGSAGNCRA